MKLGVEPLAVDGVLRWRVHVELNEAIAPPVREEARGRALARDELHRVPVVDERQRELLDRERERPERRPSGRVRSKIDGRLLLPSLAAPKVGREIAPTLRSGV